MCVMWFLEIFKVIINPYNVSKRARLSLFVNKEVGFKKHLVASKPFNTVNPFNSAAIKFCPFQGLTFHCFKICLILIALICFNDEQIYSRILILALYSCLEIRENYSYAKIFGFYHADTTWS